MITKLRGEEYIMHRYQGNPIITIEDFPIESNAVLIAVRLCLKEKHYSLSRQIIKNP